MFDIISHQGTVHQNSSEITYHSHENNYNQDREKALAKIFLKQMLQKWEQECKILLPLGKSVQK